MIVAKGKIDQAAGTLSGTLAGTPGQTAGGHSAYVIETMVPRGGIEPPRPLKG